VSNADKDFNNELPDVITSDSIHLY